MKTIKIIDLLVKIAKHEKLPNAFKYDGNIYYLQKDENYDVCYRCDESGIFENCFVFEILNDEIEIIEDTSKEDKKIEKPILDTDNDVNGSYDIVIINNVKYEISKTERYILGKIGEIIDKINGE